MREIVWQAVLRSFSLKRLMNSGKALSAFLLSKLSQKAFVWGLPFIVHVEPTVACNLKCPQCLTGMGQIKRSDNFMPFELFKNFIESHSEYIWYLLLYNQGEPFRHKNLIDFIRLAKEKKIYVMTSTNGHFLSNVNSVRALIKSGLDSIIISLDGADAETYQKYRINGDFQKVIRGIENLVNQRKKLHSKTPEIMIQFLVTAHNEHQIDEMKKLCKKLGADRLLMKTFQVESFENGKHYLPINKKFNRYKKQGHNFKLKSKTKNICARLWYSTVILSDGRVVPCCFDKNGTYTFGKITDDLTLAEIWTSEHYKQFREAVSANREKIPICGNCSQNRKIYL